MSPPLVTVAIWDFTPSKRSPLLGGGVAAVHGLVVRYVFPGVPIAETESPYAQRPPTAPDDTVPFDFVKVFHVDDLTPESQLYHVVSDVDSGGSGNNVADKDAISNNTRGSWHDDPCNRSDVKDAQHLRFHLVNEPHELASFEECTTIGHANISLRKIWKTRTDLDKELVPVYTLDDADPQLLGYFTVTVKLCEALDLVLNNAPFASEG